MIITSCIIGIITWAASISLSALHSVEIAKNRRLTGCEKATLIGLNVIGGIASTVTMGLGIHGALTQPVRCLSRGAGSLGGTIKATRPERAVTLQGSSAPREIPTTRVVTQHGSTNHNQFNATGSSDKLKTVGIATGCVTEVTKITSKIVERKIKCRLNGLSPHDYLENISCGLNGTVNSSSARLVFKGGIPSDANQKLINQLLKHAKGGPSVFTNKNTLKAIGSRIRQQAQSNQGLSDEGLGKMSVDVTSELIKRMNKPLHMMTKIPIIFHEHFQDFKCPISQKPIRFILQIADQKSSRTYYEKATIERWFRENPKKTPPGWPQSLKSTQCSFSYLTTYNRDHQETIRLQSLINERLQSCFNYLKEPD